MLKIFYQNKTGEGINNVIIKKIQDAVDYLRKDIIVYISSDFTKVDLRCIMKDYKDKEYKELEIEEDGTVELSMEEIAERFGIKDPNNLRIVYKKKPKGRIPYEDDYKN